MLIIDMKMPKRCFDCPMHDWTYGQHETRQNVLVCNARHELEPILSREIPNGDERPDWCPIKGVLPEQHGDLVDRDELKEKFCDDDAIDNYAREYIDAAQIIIAAERKDDDKTRSNTPS